MTAALVVRTMAQKEGNQLLAFAAQVVGSGFLSPDQVAGSLVDYVRHPRSGQFARPMHPRQSDRVPSVRLMRSPDRLGIRAGATSMQS